MTIDTSKEAVERLALLHEGISFAEATGSRQCLVDVDDARFMHDLAAERDKLFEGAGAHHVAAMREAQRADQQTARADAAEAREQALLSSYDAERKALVENAAMRHDIARLTKSLSDEVTARVAAEAEVARLTAELTALRAGQDALVAAAYEAAAEWLMTVPQKLPNRDQYAKHIRALTTPDATAALDAKLLAERNKALRDAADRTLGLATGHECRNAILAMIETEGK